MQNISTALGLRVLCVDDDPDTADTLGTFLELIGFEPHVFYDGESALKALREFRPDACVLDLSMPKMDGCTLARRLREWAGNRPLPLVAVTAQADESARRETAAAGFDYHLTKPFDPDTLAMLVADIVILRGDLWEDGPIS
jgi:CheY-like chemotaxis protein